MAYNPNNPNGRAAASGSAPYVLSTEDKAVLDNIQNNQTNGNQITQISTNRLTDFRNSSIILTCTALNSLASSATACAISDRVTNMRNAIDILIHVIVDFANTAPASDKTMYIWLLPWYYDGTTYTHADIGTSTAASTTSAAITLGATHNLTLLGVMTYTTADQVCRKIFSMAKAFGPTLPDGFSIIYQNSTGAAVAASGSSTLYREVFQKSIV